MSRYRHPREIENFDNLAIYDEPTVSKAKSGITLRKDGDDTPRDWQLKSRWGFGRKTLWFTKLHRKSPSAMATQVDYELAFHWGPGAEGRWQLRGGALDETVSRESVDDLVPTRFSGWLRQQERSDLSWWEKAA